MKKDVLVIVFALLTAASVAVAVVSFEKQNKLGKSLEEEKYSRMVAEESSQKSAAKVAVYENQLKSANEKMAKLKDILDQQQGVNEELKSQYDKLAQTKEDLEAKLKTTLDEKAAAQTATAVVPQEASSASAVDGQAK